MHMDEVLSSCQTIVRSAQQVRINDVALRDFADSISEHELHQTEFATALADFDEDQRIAFVLLFESICFSFWGTPKWTTTIDGEHFDGSAGLLRAIIYAACRYDLFSAASLRSMSRQDFLDICAGNVEIPLFNERLCMARELGEYIHSSYAGSFQSFLESTNWNALEIVHRLVQDLPAVFDDAPLYNGIKVCFYKRAQLVPAKLADLFQEDLLSHPIGSVDKLTGFADYKIPQLLRNLSVLNYTSELAQKIDSQTELLPASQDEIEIRAATIIALDMITARVHKRIPSATAAKVDTAIFLATQNNVSLAPYHRTRTIWY